MANNKNNNTAVEANVILIKLDAGTWPATSAWKEEHFDLIEGQIPKNASTGGRRMVDKKVSYKFRQLIDNTMYFIKHFAFQTDFGLAVSCVPFANVDVKLKVQSDVKAKMEHLTGKEIDIIEIPDNPASIVIWAVSIFKGVYMDHKSHVITNLKTLAIDWMAENPKLRLTMKDYPTDAHLTDLLRFNVHIASFTFPEETMLQRLKLEAADAVMSESKERQNKVNDLIDESRSKFDSFAEGCVAQLMEGAIDIVGKLHQQLRNSQKLNAGTVKSFHDYFDKVRMLNFTGDKSLDNMMGAIRDELVAFDANNYTDASMVTDSRLAEAMKGLMTDSVKVATIEADQLMSELVVSEDSDVSAEEVVSRPVSLAQRMAARLAA